MTDTAQRYAEFVIRTSCLYDHLHEIMSLTVVSFSDSNQRQFWLHIHWYLITNMGEMFSLKRIQGDVEGKVNILGRHNSSRCEKEVHLNMCIILNC